MYIRFFGLSTDFCDAFASKKDFWYLVPSYIFIVQNQWFTADVSSKDSICLSVTDNVTVGYVVVGIIDILLHQSDVWFAGRRIILREVRIDQNLVEGDAFSGKCLKDKIVDGPEGVFGERCGA